MVDVNSTQGRGIKIDEKSYTSGDFSLLSIQANGKLPVSISERNGSDSFYSMVL